MLTLESEPLPDGYAYPAVIQTRDGLVHITCTWNRRRTAMSSSIRGDCDECFNIN